MGVAETKSAVLGAAGTLLRSPEVTLTTERPAAMS